MNRFVLESGSALVLALVLLVIVAFTHMTERRHRPQELTPGTFGSVASGVVHVLFTD